MRHQSPLKRYDNSKMPLGSYLHDETICLNTNKESTESQSHQGWKMRRRCYGAFG